MLTDPLVGAINPPSILIVVVLPAPFGPSSATISDRATSKLTFGASRPTVCPAVSIVAMSLSTPTTSRAAPARIAVP